MQKTLLIVFLSLISPVVWAHAPVPGLNSFLNGAVHPLLIPAHIIVLIAMGLLIGRQGSDSIGKVLPVFMLLIIPGVILSLWINGGESLALIILIFAFILGILIALGKSLPIWALMVFTCMTALLIGIDSAQMAFTGKDRYIALGGTVVGSSILLIYAAGFTEYLQKLWQGIPVRIIGSWLAASAIMVLTLSLRNL
jgi:hydrogenase/urease accessory protein HupE